MNTAERLQSYGAFDETVIEIVERVAHEQNQSTYTELVDKYGIEDGPEIFFGTGQHKPIEILTINPFKYCDPTRARLLYAPMGIPVDASMAMRGLRLFASDPSEQLLIVGNAGAPPRNTGRLRVNELITVARGNLAPTVDPVIDYLRAKHVTQTTHIGYSFGADKSATAVKRAAERDIQSDYAVMIEPASVTKRSVLALGKAFAAAGSKLEPTIKAVDSQPLIEARNLADTGLVRYLMGIGRLTNIAIAEALSSGHFEQRVTQAIHYQPNMHATIAWGTQSELSEPAVLTDMAERLQRRFGEQHIAALAIDGMRHAGGDDIDLHAAIVLQALRTS
jgi:hypothetical protein